MDLHPVKGSLADIARRGDISLAESFLSCSAIILFDSSGSMASPDSREGKSRYNVALEELAKLQRSMPGKIAVIAFSSETMFCPAGLPPYLGGLTDLAGALTFAKVADLPGMRFVVVSDGEPNSEAEALRVAKTYQNRIDTVYCGPEYCPEGRDFLSRLAKASGGVQVTADRVKELAGKIEVLLLEGK